MGAAQQKEATVYFSSVATVAEHPTDEEFSTQLLHYRTGLCGGAELFFVAQPIVSQLVEASGSNGRVRWLVNYCLRTLTSAAGSTTPERLDLLCAALHVLDVTCRTMFCGSGGDIRRVLSLLGLEAKAKPPSTEGASDGVALCHQLMSFTSLIPLTAETVSAHHAVTRTLLALLSTPIYHKPIVDEHELDGGILAVLGAPDYLVQPFVSTLTTRLAEWGSTTRSFSSPSLTYESSKPQSARRFFGWWGSGKSDSTASTANSESGKLLARAGMSFVTSTTCDEQVYRHSAQLLALLISYHKGRLPNVVHYQFLVKPIGPPIGFAVLLRSIATKLTTCPAIAVVLYCLLNDSPNCLKAVMEEDADSLMRVMVELYHLIHLVCTTGGSSTSQPGSTSAVAVPCGISSDNLPELLPVLTTELLRFSYPFIHFMAGTLFLLLSQDRVINQYCCSATCPIPPYYHNRYASGGTVTISSLALIAHCMGISVGVTERNEALGALFIPSLANFSLFAHDLDIYGAQRLIHLVCMIVRKIRRTLLATGAKFDQAVDGCDELPSEAGDSAFVTSGSASSIAADIVGDMDLLVLQLRTVVEAVEGFLHGVNRHNEALIYEILYARETLLLFHQSLVVQSPIGDSITSRVTDCLTNMHDLIHHYEAEVASHTSGTSSPSEILGIIRKTCRGGSNDVAADLSAPSKGDPLLSEGGQGKVGDLLYTYEESPQSYSFFAPFLWATMLSDAQRPGGMLWARDCDSLPLFQS